jgi:hypothetical protein
LELRNKKQKEQSKTTALVNLNDFLDQIIQEYDKFNQLMKKRKTIENVSDDIQQSSVLQSLKNSKQNLKLMIQNIQNSDLYKNLQKDQDRQTAFNIIKDKLRKLSEIQSGNSKILESDQEKQRGKIKQSKKTSSERVKEESQAVDILITENKKIMKFVKDKTKEIENQIQNVDDDNVSSIKESINNVEEELKNMIQSFQNSKEYKTLENSDKFKRYANTYKEELDELSKNYDENTKSNLLFLLDLRQKYNKSKNLPSNEDRLKILKEIKKELDDRLNEREPTRWSTSIAHFYQDIIGAINKTESEISQKNHSQTLEQIQLRNKQHEQKRKKEKQNFDNLRAEKQNINDFLENKRKEIENQIENVDNDNDEASIKQSIKYGQDELNQMIQTIENSNLYKENIQNIAWSNLTRALKGAPKHYQTMKKVLQLKLQKKLDQLTKTNTTTNQQNDKPMDTNQPEIKKQSSKQKPTERRVTFSDSVLVKTTEDIDKQTEQRIKKENQQKQRSKAIVSTTTPNLNTQTNTTKQQNNKSIDTKQAKIQKQKQQNTSNVTDSTTTQKNLNTQTNTTNQVKIQKQQQQPTQQKQNLSDLEKIESDLDKLDVSKAREKISLDGSTTGGTTKKQMQNQFVTLNSKIQRLKDKYKNNTDQVNKLTQLQKRSDKIKQNNKQIYNFFELQKILEKDSSNTQQTKLGKILDFLTSSNNIKNRLRNKKESTQNIENFQKSAKEQLLKNLEKVVNKSTDFTKVSNFLQKAKIYFPENKLDNLIQINILNQQQKKKRQQEKASRQRQKLQKEKSQKLRLQQEKKNKLSSIQSEISPTTGNQELQSYKNSLQQLKFDNNSSFNKKKQNLLSQINSKIQSNNYKELNKLKQLAKDDVGGAYQILSNLEKNLPNDTDNENIISDIDRILYSKKSLMGLDKGAFTNKNIGDVFPTMNDFKNRENKTKQDFVKQAKATRPVMNTASNVIRNIFSSGDEE